MSIKFAIVKSKLINNPTGYAARIQPAGKVEFADLIDRVADCNTGVSKSDALGVIEDFYAVIEKLIRDGMIVSTPHVHYHTSVQGTFEDEGDTFDQARHEVRIRVTAGSRLRRALRDVQVEKGTTDPRRPRPQTYFDVESGTRNVTLTSGGMGRLVGKHVGFDPGDPLQGIFFVDSAEVETKVEAVAWNKPSQLIFMVPALAAGEYGLVVRAILNNTTEVREGKLDTALTVA